MAIADADVVAQIDACEIADGVGDVIMPRWLVHRARDEIVALRTGIRTALARVEDLVVNLSATNTALKTARAEALEEAARECDHMAEHSTGGRADTAFGLADDIRALKDKP